MLIVGNNAWNLIEGTQFGETQSATASVCTILSPALCMVVGGAFIMFRMCC